MSDDDQIRFTLRISKSLFKRINEAAEAAQRSANAEIFSTLLEKYGSDSGSELENLKQFRNDLAVDLKAKSLTETAIKEILDKSDDDHDDTARLEAFHAETSQSIQIVRSRLAALDAAIHAMRDASHPRKRQKIS